MIKKSVDVFILPGKCAVVKLNCRTKAHAFKKVWNPLVWKNRATDLLFVKMMTGFGFPQNICPTSLNAKDIAKTSSA